MDEIPVVFDRFSCANCADNTSLGFDFTMAFQPIVDCQQQRIFGYEALVRGLNNESAQTVIAKVNNDNRYQFDQMCRIKAIALAAKLGLSSMLSINFLPNAIYKPERCIRTTLAAAKQYGFPIEQIMFEFTENEPIQDSDFIKDIVNFYQNTGFKTALDDFGAGYAGLGLLADFQTDIIKLDMALIRDIDKDHTRQRIICHCLNLFNDLNITALAEGVESAGEMQWLKAAGVSMMQGYYFAKPGFECLPSVNGLR